MAVPTSDLKQRLHWEDPEHLRVGQASFLMALQSISPDPVAAEIGARILAMTE